MPVVGAIPRKGNVVAQVIERASVSPLPKFVRVTVSNRVSLLSPYEFAGYNDLRHFGCAHATVNHADGKYVRRNVHTANIDSCGPC
jgi:hypothetical protein